MDLYDLDLFLNSLEMETVNCTHQGNVKSFDFKVIGDNAWAQVIQETPSENSCSQSPENLPANDNIGGFFLGNVKVEESKNDSGRRWSSSQKNTSSIFSFGDPSSSMVLDERPNSVKRISKKLKTTHSSPESANREHVIAERKRRERVTKYICTLAGLVPGLKKRDKASVLTKTIEYMKLMQERVKTLEEQIVKGDGEALPTSEQSKLVSVLRTEEQSPKIEIKAFGSTYLIKIYCFQARKGTLGKALNLIENLHLRVVTTYSVQISEQILELTITSQVDEGFEMKMKDILKRLQLEFQHFA